MATYRLVQVSFWQDDFVLDLTQEERYFYLYLLTCTKTTQCGIYQLPRKVSELELGLPYDMVEKLLQRFIDYGKVIYDEQTREVLLVNWVRYNPITNTNVEKCVLRELKNVKSKHFVNLFLERCLAEELSIPLLLKYFGMPVKESHDDQAEMGKQELVEEVSTIEVDLEPKEEPVVTETAAKPKEEIPIGTSDVFTFYEEHFSSLSSYVVEELNGWIQDLSEELVLKALHIAHDKDKRTLAYVKGILRDWHRKGLRCPADVEEEKKEFEKKEKMEPERKNQHDPFAETKKMFEEMEQWEKQAASEEELQQFLKEASWKP
ncbi:DnaD domain-containing protein [Ectobacillus polymachus]|uniref:DnaD domain-containing protein n=1 Tax=Ectobacillus polymachus TaxID=1508806 RepID=UPI003A8A3F92